MRSMLVFMDGGGLVYIELYMYRGSRVCNLHSRTFMIFTIFHNMILSFIFLFNFNEET